MKIGNPAYRIIGGSGLAPGEHEVAYPKVAITYDYTPGRPAYTPRGEYGPIDPPDPPEINLIEAKLIDGDGLGPSLQQVRDWAIDYLDTDEGFEAACNHACVHHRLAGRNVCIKGDVGTMPLFVDKVREN